MERHNGRNKTRLEYSSSTSLSSQTLSLFSPYIESAGGTAPPPASGSGSGSGTDITDTASFDTARKTTANTQFDTENPHLLLFASFKMTKLAFDNYI